MTRRFEAARGLEVIRVRGHLRSTALDRAAVEEPLEVRLHGRPFSVIMRTPGADRELAAGFLLSERVLRSADDLGAIEHCTDPDPDRVARHDSDAARPFHDRDETAGGPPFEGRNEVGAPPLQDRDNIVNVTLTDPSRVDALFADRRNVTTNSSCGLCGRRTIDSLRVDLGIVTAQTTLGREALVGLPDRLREAQTVFDETGGLHAAGLFSASGELIDVAEDVGRHNAVDKVIGRRLMRDELPLSGAVLFVSGRMSFEIVQKALSAGIPIVASVSAPSSLAVDLASETGITLASFVRGDSFNIYSHARRIQD